MAAIAGLGAALGALARYEMTRLIQSIHGNHWPLATLLINWLGSILLGFLTGWQADQMMTVLLGTGILGGFTTYSTFSHEVVMLADQRRYGAMTAYLSLSVLGGLALASAGGYLGWLLR